MTTDIKKEIEEEGAPTNSAGSGAVEGIGVGPKGEPGVPRKYKMLKFAGHDVFEVDNHTYHNARLGKKKYSRWASYVGEDETGSAIRDYAYKNPASPIILQNETTGGMMYLRYGKKQ